METNDEQNDNLRDYEAAHQGDDETTLREEVMIESAMVDDSIALATAHVERLCRLLGIARDRGLEIETAFEPLAWAFTHAASWRSVTGGSESMAKSSLVNSQTSAVLQYLDSVERLQRRAAVNSADVSYHLRAREILDRFGIDPAALAPLPSLQGVRTELSKPAACIVAALTPFCLGAGAEE